MKIMHSAHIYIFVVALFLISTVKGINNNAEMWKKKLLYMDTANLTCEDNVFDPVKQQGVAFYWLLPSGKVIGTNNLPQGDRYRLLNNGSSLIIDNIDKSDFGVYFCLVVMYSQSTVLRAIKLGINVDGPYFGDLWEKYQSNLRNGLLASGVTFIIMSMFCYNHSQFQNRHDKPNKFKSSSNIEFSLQTYFDGHRKGHSNSAFVHDLIERKNDTNDKDITLDVPMDPETKL